jgi:signal transduction histidine kinase
MVERNVQKVSRTVKDLLYCSKERQPKFQADVSPTAVLREVAALYRNRMRDEKISLEVDADDQIPPGRYDPDGLQNMLSNLTANAIDACRFDVDSSKPAHHVRLSCALSGDGIAFEVADDGAGIPAEVVDKVFLDFFSTKGTEGTGVGLLVVQKVAEEHGGQVTFSTAEGRGTTFRVQLPQA